MGSIDPSCLMGLPHMDWDYYGFYIYSPLDYYALIFISTVSKSFTKAIVDSY